MDGDTLRRFLEVLAPVVTVALAPAVGRLFGLNRRRRGFVTN